VITERLCAFRQGLKDTDYIDGENVELICRFADNQVDGFRLWRVIWFNAKCPLSLQQGMM
jgi:hypothetical protein